MIHFRILDDPDPDPFDHPDHPDRFRTLAMLLKIYSIKNREVEIDNTSYSHITSWQSQSLGNRSPNKVEASSGINSAQASASNIKELRGEGFVKPILLL